MTLKPGDIILCSTRYSLVSWAIRKIEHCHWSHVAWVVNDTMAIEALAGGVTWTPLYKFDLHDDRKCRVVRIKREFVCEQQLRKALFIAMGWSGRPYDWTCIFRLAWSWAMKLRHKQPVAGDRHRLICSELIAMPLWQSAAFSFRDEIPPENTAPKDIALSDRVEVLHSILQE